MALEINKSYYSAIQATNELDYVQSMRSDGFVVADTDVTTTAVQPGPFTMVPGRVRDGDKVGIDVNYQESTTTLSAIWAGFHTCANGNGKERHDLSITICTSVQCSREKILVRYLYQKLSSRDQRGKGWGS